MKKLKRKSLCRKRKKSLALVQIVRKNFLLRNLIVMTVARIVLRNLMRLSESFVILSR